MPQPQEIGIVVVNKPLIIASMALFPGEQGGIGGLPLDSHDENTERRIRPFLHTKWMLFSSR